MPLFIASARKKNRCECGSTGVWHVLVSCVDLVCMCVFVCVSLKRCINWGRDNEAREDIDLTVWIMDVKGLAKKG